MATPTPETRERRIVVLISGSGTNLQALIDAQNTPALSSTRISLVLSNRKAAYGLTRAAQAVPPIPTATRDDYDRAVAARVVEETPDLVVLAGWMHIMGDGFLDVIGARGVPIKHSGVMVHYVVKEVDRGEPILVREVEILPGEPIEAFEERLHGLEWKIIVEATAKVLDKVHQSK
ncbi:phosphoribosylglycinamide formyltransferase [Epithele typhae]|uniref:phosphoribosylglycinamide formyltransferase n=1 Tax=Epithele typhae TaxID=378194 RepID=UPI002007C5A5|nr:phosphoribosylglycinamide formyltransferase [Epithele typhae]KAH9944502.1 phosphoribosylglycinamide formyltransferase [Epithele typhae]